MEPLSSNKLVQQFIISTKIINTKKVAAFDGRLIVGNGRQFTILRYTSSVLLPERLEVQSVLLLRLVR